MIRPAGLRVIMPADLGPPRYAPGRSASSEGWGTSQMQKPPDSPGRTIVQLTYLDQYQNAAANVV